MTEGSSRRWAVVCVLLAVAVCALIALHPRTRRIFPLQLREAARGIAAARVDVSNANPEDLYMDVWDVESLSRLQTLQPLAETLRDYRQDWRVQIAIAADERAHGPYDELKLRRIKACYERAMELAPSRVLPRSDLVLWLCGSQIRYVREEIAATYGNIEARPLEADPEFLNLAVQHLEELRRIEPRNALWHVLYAYVRFGQDRDEEGLAALHLAAAGSTLNDHLLYDSAIIAQVNELRGLPSYEAKMAAIAAQVFAHWPRVTQTLRLAGLLAADKERAGDRRGAAATYGDILRIAVIGRDSATYALQADVMSKAVEISYRHALASLNNERLVGLDQLSRAERAAGTYFKHSGRNDLAEFASGQLEASHDLSTAIRTGSGRRGGEAWAEWNSSWFRPTAMWGASVLLLGQAIVLALLWFGASLASWVRSLFRYPILQAPERSTSVSVLIVALAPAVSAPLALLWNSWHTDIGWPASQTEVVAPAGGWFLSFVGVCVLPLLTLLAIAAVAAGWRRYRRRHLNVGFVGEALALLRGALPLALCVTLAIYALSLIPLVQVRAHAEALAEHALTYGEMSFLR